MAKAFHRRVSRWVVLGAALAGVLLLAAVRGWGAVEVPSLALRVAEGKLPKVEERLPRNPVVVQPVDRVGRYGGTLNLVLQGAGDLAWLERMLAGESLVRWDPTWTRIIPNLAASWSVNSNATEYVFHLRKGVRWSDGAPFTADDLVFWNERIFRSGIAMPQWVNSWAMAGGKPVVVSKRDEATVVFSFAAPNGMLLYGLAGLMGDEPVSYPRHYLGKFDPEINPEGVPSLLKAEGVGDWKDLVRRRIGSGVRESPRHRWRAAELPRLTAWQLVPGFGFGKTNRVVAERNPFYWKVDIAGNQLPYIDRVEFAILPDWVMMLEAALRGDVDFGERVLTGAQNLPTLKERATQCGFHLNRVTTDSGNLAAICLNLTHTNPARRSLYQDKNFRIALSHAIDRERVIREALKAPGEPRQVAPKPESPMYVDRLAKQYTKFDAALASELLDAAGLAGRDAEGWRVMTNGARLSLTLHVASSHGSRIVAMRIVKENWAAVGVFAELVLEDADRINSLRLKNAHDVMVWAGDGGLDVIMDPRFYVPVTDGSLFGVAWNQWFANPASATAMIPPEPIRKQMELYRQVQASPRIEDQRKLMRQVLEITADFFPAIGLCTADDTALLVKDSLQNVPRVFISSGRSFPAPSPQNPCQFFFDPPEPDAP